MPGYAEKTPEIGRYRTLGEDFRIGPSGRDDGWDEPLPRDHAGHGLPLSPRVFDGASCRGMGRILTNQFRESVNHRGGKDNGVRGQLNSNGS